MRLYIFSAINIYPDYIAYFNESIGGPKNGYKYLDDSNLEWRHDLKRLAIYQEKHPNTKVINPSVQYVDLSYYGVKNNIYNPRTKWWINLRGRYAINSQLLVRTKWLSKVYNDKSLNWMDLYEPIDRIGQSFFIYEF